jgi:hypothetical protein
MSDVLDENRIIARSAATVFGGSRPTVTRYYDQARKGSVDLLACDDVPKGGVTSYATIGLSDSPLYRGSEKFPVRVEFVGACVSGSCDFAAALATAAFCVVNSRWFCAPGVIFPDIWPRDDRRTSLRHLLFVPPSFWEGFETLRLPSKTVAWLTAIPITEGEMQFAAKEGSLRLEEMFEVRRTDLFDFFRPSVV